MHGQFAKLYNAAGALLPRQRDVFKVRLFDRRRLHLGRLHLLHTGVAQVHQSHRILFKNIAQEHHEPEARNQSACECARRVSL